MATIVGIIFHGIGAPGRDLEPGEAPYWISTDRLERILDQVQAAPRPDLIQLSFDDGNASDHDIALPRLLERKLAADFFVLSGRIGQPGSLSADQIRALRDAGMGVGSHGIAHVKWPALAAADLSHELTRSKQDIETILDRPVDLAGIPFGAWDGRVLRALHGAGYRAAYSSDRGAMDPTAFLRPRTSITAAMLPVEIAAILAGHMPPLARLRRMLAVAYKRLRV